ncbi:MAG: hypothetical protein V1782_08355 [Pseudomonadota bacterium]
MFLKADLDFLAARESKLGVFTEIRAPARNTLVMKFTHTYCGAAVQANGATFFPLLISMTMVLKVCAPLRLVGKCMGGRQAVYGISAMVACFQKVTKEKMGKA